MRSGDAAIEDSAYRHHRIWGIGDRTRFPEGWWADDETRPGDGSYLQYTYDGAHRMTQLQDGLGNKIVYTLDAMGNRIKEQAYDPAGTLARVRQQVVDSLNRLHQTVGAQ